MPFLGGDLQCERQRHLLLGAFQFDLVRWELAVALILRGHSYLECLQWITTSLDLELGDGFKLHSLKHLSTQLGPRSSKDTLPGVAHGPAAPTAKGVWSPASSTLLAEPIKHLLEIQPQGRHISPPELPRLAHVFWWEVKDEREIQTFKFISPVKKKKGSDTVSYMTWPLALFSNFCVKKIVSRQGKGKRGLEA